MLDSSQCCSLNKKEATRMRGSRENNYAREETSKKDSRMCARVRKENLRVECSETRRERVMREYINSPNFFSSSL